MDWLEARLKACKEWPLAGIQTIPDEFTVAAYNQFHGAEAGLITAPTLREAIDAAMKAPRHRATTST
jgi:hypothetical protein